MRVAEQILDLARWAPSGDNTQPWRFEIKSDQEILVHGYDTREHCVYDLDGWASQLAHGALLETLTLAATRFGMQASVVSTDAVSEQHIVYRVILERDPSVVEHPLVRHIEHRTVQRRPMATRPLTGLQRSTLEATARPYKVVWLESMRDRWRMAYMSFRSAHIRLTIPEAFAVHKAVIAWNTKTSEDRLPDAALGADPLLLAVMRWAMVDWKRVRLLNRFAAGTLMPRIALDLWPALRCSAHFALLATDEPVRPEERIEAGRIVQRFWLEAEKLQLQIQPNYTPLVFARYAKENRHFTGLGAAQRRASEIARRLADAFSKNNPAQVVFLGRIGAAHPVKGRSLRLPLHRIIANGPPSWF